MRLGESLLVVGIRLYMAITVGLIRELSYISKVMNRAFYFTLAPSEAQETPISINICFEIMDVWYKEFHIWNESLSEGSFFGIESCDTISRIIHCIDNKQPWQDKYYYNESQKTP
jgi:hypothetical protein